MFRESLIVGLSFMLLLVGDDNSVVINYVLFSFCFLRNLEYMMLNILL